MIEKEFRLHMDFTIGACRDEKNEKLAKQLEELVEAAVRFKNGVADNKGELYDLWWSMPQRTSMYQNYAVEQSRRLLNNFAGL